MSLISDGDLRHLGPAIEDPHQHRVGAEQRRGADHAAQERGVVADDGVLHRVRQHEQDDEVERIELGQHPLARLLEREHQQQVDQHGPNDLLHHRDGVRGVAEHAEVHEVGPEGGPVEMGHQEVSAD